MVIRRRTKSRRPRADERGRGALIRLLDRYVEALVAHDPARLPMSPRTRFTENGQQLSLGEGLWGTATGASHRRYVEFVDPAAGQVGFFGIVEEHGAPCIVAVRMKVVKRMITQLETLVVRNRAMTRKVAEAAHIDGDGLAPAGPTPGRPGQSRFDVRADVGHISANPRRARQWS